MRAARAVLLGFLCLAVPVRPVAQADDPWRRVFISDPLGQMTVRHALARASERLVDEECQALFTSFKDSNGHPLAERLAALGIAPKAYLHFVVFVESGQQGRCEGQELAYTVPGSRVVFVCVSRFEAGWRSHPVYAEAALIHEALHTLGLSENPPSSSEITARVRQACRDKTKK